MEYTRKHITSRQQVVFALLVPKLSTSLEQAVKVWIYTQSNITQASYSPEYITPTQQIS
jgi:hypothetical protein